MRSLIVGLSIVLAGSSAWADTLDPSLNLFSIRPIKDPWHIDWLSIGDQTTVVPARSLAFVSVPPLQQGDAQPLQQDDAQPLHAAAIEHSNAYQTRAKIHKYSSFATLPLFAVEVALGQSLYNTPRGPALARTHRTCVRRRGDRRALRVEHRHRCLESVWRRVERPGGAHAATRARFADDGRGRRLRRHDGLRTQQSAARARRSRSKPAR